MTADTIVFKCGMGKRFCCEQRWEDFWKTTPETCTDKNFIIEIKTCSLCKTKIHKVKDTNTILIGVKNNLSIAFDLKTKQLTKSQIIYIGAYSLQTPVPNVLGYDG